MSISAKNYIDEKTIDLLAGVFDYAANKCKTGGDIFWNYFVLSDLSAQIENGNPKYVLGRDAVEIVSEVFERVNVTPVSFPDYISMDRTPEFWGGWALAHYQLHSGLSYKKIHDFVTFEDFLNLYQPYHEAPVQKLCSLLDERQSVSDSRLKKQRERIGFSQSALAVRVGTSVKTIQAYEQRLKDIRHAKMETIEKLSAALACKTEDLF